MIYKDFKIFNNYFSAVLVVDGTLLQNQSFDKKDADMLFIKYRLFIVALAKQVHRIAKLVKIDKRTDDNE